MNADSNPPVYFDCSLCGECCSSWNIPIEGEKAKALLGKPWVQQRLSTTHRDLSPVSEDLYRIPLTDSNVCVFLAEDRRCLIEVNEGLALKPHECQRFPFASVKMPDGKTCHDTSAACKWISEHLLQAFQPILPKPAVLSGEVADSLSSLKAQESEAFEVMEDFPRRVRVGFWKTTTVNHYERWVDAVRNIFITPNIAPFEALKQARFLLKHVPGRDSVHENSRNSKAALSQRFLSQAFLTRQAWRDVWIVVFFLRKPYRTLSLYQLLRGKRYEDPRVFGLPVDLQAQRRLSWNAEQNARLNAFLFNIVSRRLPVARGQSLASLLAMAACAGILTQWYAATLAWARESETIDANDVSVAVRLVERYYTGHQPRFMHFFRSCWKGALLDWFLFG